ncbi:MAG: hypothetical protein N2Z72_07025 [Bacteroidales bacterium]|nr:hypothetical protein [Bacteroidales bacterium]
MLSSGKFIVYLLSFLTLFLNSCIELEEKIVLHSDKSGEYSLVIRGFSGFQTNASFSEKIKESILLFISKAQKVNGISSIKQSSTRNEFSISFSFEHPSAFRSLMAEMTNVSKFFIPSYFSFTRHRFSKQNTTPFFQKALQRDSTIHNILTRFSTLPFGSLFNWKIVVVSPYEIKKVKRNPYVIISSDHKIATLTLSLEQIMQNTSSGFVLRLK